MGPAVSVEPAQQPIASVNTPSLVVDAAYHVPDAPEHHDMLQEPTVGLLDSFPSTYDAPFESNFTEFFDFGDASLEPSTTDFSFTDYAPQLVDLGATNACDGSATVGF